MPARLPLFGEVCGITSFCLSHSLSGAFAMAVIFAIERVGTRATIANWQRKHYASARRSNHRKARCRSLTNQKNLYRLPGAFAKTVTLSTERIAKQERPSRIVSADTAPRTSPWRHATCAQRLYRHKLSTGQFMGVTGQMSLAPCRPT